MAPNYNVAGHYYKLPSLLQTPNYTIRGVKIMLPPMNMVPTTLNNTPLYFRNAEKLLRLRNKLVYPVFVSLDDFKHATIRHRCKRRIVAAIVECLREDGYAYDGTYRGSETGAGASANKGRNMDLVGSIAVFTKRPVLDIEYPELKKDMQRVLRKFKQLPEPTPAEAEKIKRQAGLGAHWNLENLVDKAMKDNPYYKPFSWNQNEGKVSRVEDRWGRIQSHTQASGGKGQSRGGFIAGLGDASAQHEEALARLRERARVASMKRQQ